MVAKGALIEKLFSNPVMYRLGLIVFQSTRFPSDVTIRINSQKVYSRSLDRFLATLLWKYSLSGGFERSLVGRLLKPGQVAVDIGANIGFYSMLMATLVGPAGKICAFEPDTDNFRLLNKNLITNGFENVCTEKKAIAAKTGTGMLYVNPSHRGDHRIYPHEDQRETVPIQTVSLDDYFSDSRHVDFIKMDIQGAEVEALMGMKNIVHRNTGIQIITEFSPGHIESAGYSPAQFFEVIDSYGLTPRIIDEGCRNLLPVKRAFIDGIVGEKMKYWNLLLARQD